MSWIYLLGLLASIAGNLLVAGVTEYGVRIDGCYHYDALVVWVACDGFAGSEVVEVLLMWPFWQIFGPVFGLFHSPLLLLALPFWMPPVYLLVSYLRQWLGKAKNSPSSSIPPEF